MYIIRIRIIHTQTLSTKHTISHIRITNISHISTPCTIPPLTHPRMINNIITTTKHSKRKSFSKTNTVSITIQIQITLSTKRITSNRILKFMLSPTPTNIITITHTNSIITIILIMINQTIRISTNMNWTIRGSICTPVFSIIFSFQTEILIFASRKRSLKIFYTILIIFTTRQQTTISHIRKPLSTITIKSCSNSALL